MVTQTPTIKMRTITVIIIRTFINLPKTNRRFAIFLNFCTLLNISTTRTHRLLNIMNPSRRVNCPNTRLTSWKKIISPLSKAIIAGFSKRKSGNILWNNSKIIMNTMLTIFWDDLLR